MIDAMDTILRLLTILKYKVVNAIIFIFCIIVSTIRIAFKTIISIFKAYEFFKDGSFWMALFYQPILVSLVFAMSLKWFEPAIVDYISEDRNEIFRIVFAAVALITIIIFFNAFFEFIIRIWFKNIDFIAVFSIQKHAHNYYLAIISLVAIYTAINPYRANEINAIILLIGVLVLLCIIMTDLYEALFLANGVVEEEYNDMMKYYDEKKRL